MIKFKNISLCYDGKKIINNLSFEIDKGDKVVFYGKSGSGKSSLFNLLLGFVEPDSGEIIFQDKRINEKNIWDIRKKIAFIDQDVSLGSIRIVELFNFVSRLKVNAKLDFDRKEIGFLLSYFELGNGIDEIMNKETGELSGGERQRLALVISILLKRDVFLLDEVTSALDSELKKKVVDYFIGEKAVTCLVSSHDAVWLDKPGVKIFSLGEGVWKP